MYSQQDDVFWEEPKLSSPAHEFCNKIVIIVIFTWVHLCVDILSYSYAVVSFGSHSEVNLN